MANGLEHDRRGNETEANVRSQRREESTPAPAGPFGISQTVEQLTGSTPRKLDTASVLGMQGRAGNRAIAAMLATSRQTPMSVQRLGGKPDPLPVQRGRKNRNKRKRNRGGQTQKQNQPTQAPVQIVTPPTPTTTSGGSSTGGGMLGMLSSAVGWLWGKPTVGTEGESEGEHSLLSKEQQEQVEFQHGEKEEEAPPDARGLLEKLVDIPRVQIKLEGETSGTLGKVKATGSSSYGATGGQVKGKLEWEKDWIGGEKSTDLAFAGGDGKLAAKGTFFGGAKAKGEFEGTGEGGKYASKGKLAAFAGLEAKGETEVTLNVGGHETKMKGALGVTVGVGGELSYNLTFAEGVLKWGSKGKLAVGVGGSFEYELTLPVASIGSQLWSWLSTAGSTIWANMTWENLYDLAMSG